MIILMQIDDLFLGSEFILDVGTICHIVIILDSAFKREHSDIEDKQLKCCRS